MNNHSWQGLQSKLGFVFQNQKLFKQAFTHSSYVNEHRLSIHDSNERLEFLGDAVLELTVSEYLYQLYPDIAEGELTKQRAAIVCEPSLVTFAESLDFGSHILLGKGEELTGGRTRPSLLADVFEAFIGALFLDQGLDKVKQFLHKYVFPKLDGEKSPQIIDFKSQLQEHTQHHNLGVLEYRVIKESGPAHDKEFISQVFVGERVLGVGNGRSKKESEQHAAAQALEKLNVEVK